MFIITLWFGPEVPAPGKSPLVLKKVVVAPDASDAAAAFAEQDGVAWVDIVSAIPIDPEAAFTVIDS